MILHLIKGQLMSDLDNSQLGRTVLITNHSF